MKKGNEIEENFEFTATNTTSNIVTLKVENYQKSGAVGNEIERFFGRLKEKRHIATRFDKLASRFSSFVYLASIFYWI